MLAQDTDKAEQDSIMAWLDRRLEYANKSTFPLYLSQFRRDWLNTFGTADNIPQWYKDKVTAQYDRLKAGETQ